MNHSAYAREEHLWYVKKATWDMHREGMELTREWYGVHTGRVWGLYREGMGCTHDGYVEHAERHAGAGQGGRGAWLVWSLRMAGHAQGGRGRAECVTAV